MTYGTAPILNGVTLPRPNGAAEDPEAVGSDVVLAAGKLVRYDRGRRFTTSLEWNKLTEAELATIRLAAVTGVSSYVGPDGVTRVVLCDPVKVTPIAGTDPVRFDAELALREQTPRSS